HVENHHVEALSLFDEPLQSRFAVRRNFHGVPFGLQVEAQTVGQVRLVLYYQHPAHATVTFRGNSMVTVVPFPAPSLSANTRPPCFRAIDRTMNNPRPVPFTCE